MTSDVLTRREGAAGFLSLNRPAALHAADVFGRIAIERRRQVDARGLSSEILCIVSSDHDRTESALDPFHINSSERGD